MSARGSGSCSPCSPCENLVGCSETPALHCVPKYLCAEVTITEGAGENLCCDAGKISVLMLYTAAENVCGGWGNSGSCGLVNAAFGLTLDENTSPDATFTAYLTVMYGGDPTATINESVEVTIGDGEPIDITIGPFTDGATGNSFTLRITEAGVIPHPWNKERCNPCLCARCLPAAFCVRVVKYAQDMESEFRCEGCFAARSITWDDETCQWSGTVTCGLDSYTVTISLPPIYEGACELVLEGSGEGMSGSVRLGVESIISPISPVSCVKCCDGIIYQGHYGTNCPPCTDCTAETQEEDLNCGKGLAGSMSGTLVIEDADFVVEISVAPEWCGGDCATLDPTECGCCASLEYLEDVFCPDIFRPSLFATLDAPGCDFDGQVIELIPRNAFHPAPAGSPPLNGSCGEYVSEYFALDCFGETVTGYLGLRCVLPDPVICEPAYQGPYLYKLSYFWQGACLGSGTQGDEFPTTADCDPPEFSYVVNKPLSTIVPPDPTEPCDCCDSGGTFTIHISE